MPKLSTWAELIDQFPYWYWRSFGGKKRHGPYDSKVLAIDNAASHFSAKLGVQVEVDQLAETVEGLETRWPRSMADRDGKRVCRKPILE